MKTKKRWTHLTANTARVDIVCASMMAGDVVEV
jgi:hypothetical protein